MSQQQIFVFKNFTGALKFRAGNFFAGKTFCSGEKKLTGGILEGVGKTERTPVTDRFNGDGINYSGLRK